MKQKKVIAILTAAVCALSLAACGGSSAGTAAESTAAESTAEEAAEEPAEAAAESTTEEAAPAEEAAAAEESTGGEKTVTAAMPSAWTDLFPAGELHHYDSAVLNCVYDTLVKMNGDGQYVGDLAKDWEVNDESTEITFHLNDGIAWHDGEPFTAEDIVKCFKMYSDPAVQATSRYFLEYIDGCDESGAETSEDSLAVEAPDDKTLVVKFKAPTFADTVLDDLSHLFVVPAHIFENLTADDINNPNTWAAPIGTGPFKFLSLVDGERIEFEANPDYFAGKPDIDHLVIRVVDNANMLAGLMNNEIDIVLLGGIPLDDWALAQQQDNLNTESIVTTGYQMFIINTQNELLTQPVRQAISMAIDRDTLVNQLLQGEGEAIVTPICSVNPYYNPEVEVWFDPDEAKKILEEENFPMDQKLIFSVPTGNATRERAATLIAEDLGKIGLNVEIRQVDFSTLMEDLKEGKTDFGIVGSGGSMNPTESLEMLTGSFNLCHLPDDNELAGLLKEANTKLDFDSRKEVLDEFQVKMREISPYAYLYTTNNLVAYNKRLSNVKPENFATFNWAANEWTVTD